MNNSYEEIESAGISHAPTMVSAMQRERKTNIDNYPEFYYG